MPRDQSFFVARVMNVTNLRVTWHNVRMVAAAAALCVCAKLHDTLLDRQHPYGTLFAPDRASSFLLRTINDFVPVLEMEFVVEETRLLEVLEVALPRCQSGSRCCSSVNTSTNASSQVRCRRHWRVHSSPAAPETNLGGASCERDCDRHLGGLFDLGMFDGRCLRR